LLEELSVAILSLLTRSSMATLSNEQELLGLDNCPPDLKKQELLRASELDDHHQLQPHITFFSPTVSNFYLKSPT
jgi:hypothetical protein